MNQWSVYPGTFSYSDAEIQFDMTHTGSLLSKKVVAKMTENYQYRGSMSETSFAFDYANAPKRGLEKGSSPHEIEYCRVMWMNADNLCRYALEWKDSDSGTIYILSPVELPLAKNYPKLH